MAGTLRRFATRTGWLGGMGVLAFGAPPSVAFKHHTLRLAGLDRACSLEVDVPQSGLCFDGLPEELRPSGAGRAQPAPGVLYFEQSADRTSTWIAASVAFRILTHRAGQAGWCDARAFSATLPVGPLAGPKGAVAAGSPSPGELKAPGLVPVNGTPWILQDEVGEQGVTERYYRLLDPDHVLEMETYLRSGMADSTRNRTEKALRDCLGSIRIVGPVHGGR